MNQSINATSRGSKEADGSIIKVSGPLVVADNMSGTKMFEVVRVGWESLVGEIIKIEQDTASIQVYEDTAGLTVGDPIVKTGKPLALELGPGILNNIFDGIQRPLERIQEISQSVFVPRGVDVPSLDQGKKWDFVPKGIKGGDLIGVVRENGLFREHRVMVPPKITGRVTKVAGKGSYTVADKLVELDFDGKKEVVTLSHFWPVRQARPFVEKLQGQIPMYTCQRVIDALFPTTLGGTCAVPGAFGCGKTVISQALS